MRSPPSILTRGPCLLVLLVLAGCASSAKSTRTDVVFPPPPDKARIRLVRTVTSEDDMGLSVWRKIWRAIVPHDTQNVVVAPTGLALSPDERTLYAASPVRRRVIAIDLESGAFKAIGATGQDSLRAPVGVALDAEGNAYVTDKVAAAVKVYGRDGGLLRRFGTEILKEPTGIAVDRRRQVVYVVNDGSKTEGRHTVEVFSLAGKHLRTMGGGGSPEPGYFFFPRGVAVSRTGELYVADMLNFRVQVFDPSGQLVRMFGETGTGYPGKFDKIHGIAFDTFDDIYVADAMQGIHVLNDGAQALMLFGPPFVQSASAIAISSRNRIYVSDRAAGVIEFELINTTAQDTHRAPGGTSKAATDPASTPAPAMAPPSPKKTPEAPALAH